MCADENSSWNNGLSTDKNVINVYNNRSVNTDSKTDKHALRKEYLARRESQGAIESMEKSRQILQKLIEQEAYRMSGILLIYVDFRGEVKTAPLIRELLKNHEKKIYCPRITGSKMNFFKISDMMQLIESNYGIKEPEPSAERQFIPDTYAPETCLMIMPGVVFDRNRGRIGYGRGYYDHFLADCPNLKTIALAYDCQIAPQVPMNEHDRRPDMIITETEIY